MKSHCFALFGLLASGLLGCTGLVRGAAPAPADPALVLHYRFDRDPGATAKDLSGHGNDGQIGGGASYLPEVRGRRGVLRFDGKSSFLDIGNPASLRFGGDVSFEMWVRLNRPLDQKQDIEAYLFGEYPSVNRLRFGWKFYDNLLAAYGEPDEANFLPLDRTAIGEDWVHVAVVFERPRARFYRNGQLVRDQFMPFPAATVLSGAKFLGGEPVSAPPGARLPATPDHAPVDISEFRLYRRALTAREIAAHAAGQDCPPETGAELAFEPNWYRETLTVRLTAKGRDLAGREAEIALTADGHPLRPALVPLRDVSGNSSDRFSAVADFSLAGRDHLRVKAVARIVGTNSPSEEREMLLDKPAWIHSPAGLTDAVPAPWTPIKVNSTPQDGINLEVYGRHYGFGSDPFPRRIEANGHDLLAAPIALTGRVGGKPIAWNPGTVAIAEQSPAAVTLGQDQESVDLSLRVKTRLEYDGYTIFDCAVTARRDLSLDNLVLDVPLRTEHAALCAAAYVSDPKPGISMSESYWDAVRGDLDFQFSPSIWLGDNERGLTWQAESDQDWRNPDRQKVIQILPRGGTTLFRAHFVGKTTRLAAGQTLHYKFALLATPVKPMLRDARDLRIMRSGPYGADLSLPDLAIAGKPQLKILADAGVRRLFWHVSTQNWPWPLPGSPRMDAAILRLNRAGHQAGLELYPYLIHHRFPIGVEEFDLYGGDMVQKPVKTSAWGDSAPLRENDPRPGPYRFVRNTQIVVEFCPKSAPAQDAVVSSLDERLQDYGDDGVYLDGTAQVMPCSNLEHGCGYRGEDGKIHPTYPVFACREFIRRIYLTVKAHRPDGVVDLHYWQPNPAQAAYADITFMGEQWHQLKGKGALHVSDALPLDRFRSMFMGYQIGTPADLMSYRLGSTLKLAAISLLHDVPVRLNQGGMGLAQLLTPPASFSAAGREDSEYFKLLTTLWKVRTEFGANEAAKIFYWASAPYVHVAPDQCYATLLVHPRNGVLAFVSNLSHDKQQVSLQFELGALKLGGVKLDVTNALTGDPLELGSDGKITVPLGSEAWIYLWLRPKTL